jgi:hypothetical protein
MHEVFGVADDSIRTPDEICEAIGWLDGELGCSNRHRAPTLVGALLVGQLVFAWYPIGYPNEA